MIDTDIDARRPTWRKPVGILGLLLVLGVYAMLVAQLGGMLSTWPVLVQTMVYLVLGTIWLLPLRRFLIWMETGRWSAPAS
ncbi:DUF2842 domain-containing protein [Novosphingobium sp.]|uniref:DUF2842 domain-containing protein n=1 Tax=Novosphingobium sp. TaxID=1874826 RepID=UPI003D0DB421